MDLKQFSISTIDCQWWWGSDRKFFYLLDGALAGYVSAQIDSSKPHQCYLVGLCTHENFRRQGIAKSIIDFVEAYAKSMNCTELTLTCEYRYKWLADWYQRIGFKIRQRCKNYIIMYKEL